MMEIGRLQLTIREIKKRYGPSVVFEKNMVGNIVVHPDYQAVSVGWIDLMTGNFNKWPDPSWGARAQL